MNIVDNFFVIKNDTISVDEAWIEKGMNADHMEIIKRDVPTKQDYLVFKLKHNVREWNDTLNVLFYLKPDTNRYSLLDKKNLSLSFAIDSLKDNYTVTAKWMNKGKLEIKLKK